MQTDIHALVRRHNAAEGIIAAFERGKRVGEAEELVALEEQAELAGVEGHLGRELAETGEIGHRHGAVGGIERVLARDGAAANVGGVCVVGVEGEGALAGRYADFRECAADLAFHLLRHYFATCLGKKVFRFEYAVGTYVIPRALNVCLRHGVGAKQIAEQTAEHAA